MAWVKLDDGFPDHRKLAELGSYAPLCGWLYVCGLAYCNRQLTDGLIPKFHVKRLAGFDHLSIETATIGDLGSVGETIEADDMAALLVQVGLWDDEGAHFRVHDYLSYQPSRGAVLAERAKTAERQARWKREKGVTAVTNAVTNAVSDTVINGCPVPVPDPVPKEKSAPRERATLVESPLSWDRKHGGHLTGFCDWVCLPGDLAEQFATRAAWDTAAVLAWAQAVRRQWTAAGRVPAGKPYDFWNDRWREQHATAVKSEPDWRAEIRRKAAEGGR